MRVIFSRPMSGLTRLAAVLTSLLAGMAFVVVSGAIAAPVKDKEDEKKEEKIEKIEKIEKLDSKARFNKNFDIGDRNFIRNRAFDLDNRPFFFNRAFDADDLFFDKDFD